MITSSPYRTFDAGRTGSSPQARSAATGGPPRKILSNEDVLKLLHLAIERVGGQSEWARQTGVSRMQINRTLKGRRMPPTKLCHALGLEWVIVHYGAGEDGQRQALIVSKREFLFKLQSEIDKIGTITAWCEQFRVNRSYLSQILNKRRAPGARVIAALEFSEVLVGAAKSPAMSPQSRKRPSSGKRNPHARQRTP